MKLPRVDCPQCARAIAAGPVAGRLGKGRVCRHDPPARVPGGPLVSCPGSLEVVDLPTTGEQLRLPDAAETAGEDRDRIDTLPLF
ncbi:hypothetical protein ABZT26_02765 [Streptomyces sp. NPDC005395]|uniref:hypothetical protein n=1 Tax=unclassified Streptomyces TaxID=2593676 RepID=UPI001F1AAE28|nr:hypothetical protein [Streptomyces sp. BSE6.1]